MQVVGFHVKLCLRRLLIDGFESKYCHSKIYHSYQYPNRKKCLFLKKLIGGKLVRIVCKKDLPKNWRWHRLLQMSVIILHSKPMEVLTAIASIHEVLNYMRTPWNQKISLVMQDGVLPDDFFWSIEDAYNKRRMVSPLSYNSWIIGYLIISIQLSSCFGREFLVLVGILWCLRSVQVVSKPPILVEKK